MADGPALKKAADGVRRPTRPTGGTRSAATRERLVGAALELFAIYGFEAASTRAIADKANVNLAAIKYHFANKEGLYRACAEYIAAGIGAAVGPAMEAARAKGPPRTPAEARLALEQMLNAFVQLLVADPRTENWARFVIREQMAPSPAFDILYEGVMGPAHTFATSLVATVTGKPHESDEAKLLTFSLLGQILIYRVARAAVSRRMGWHSFGPDEIAGIAATARSVLDAIEAHATLRGSS